MRNKIETEDMMDTLVLESEPLERTPLEIIWDARSIINTSFSTRFKLGALIAIGYLDPKARIYSDMTETQREFYYSEGIEPEIRDYYKYLNRR